MENYGTLQAAIHDAQDLIESSVLLTINKCNKSDNAGCVDDDLKEAFLSQFSFELVHLE